MAYGYISNNIRNKILRFLSCIIRDKWIKRIRIQIGDTRKSNLKVSRIMIPMCKSWNTTKNVLTTI